MNYDELTGRVVTPKDPEYSVFRRDYNLAIDKYPLAIVYCYNIEDVSNAIKWCRKNDVDIRIRTRGHNYEGYSIGNCALVIDTSYMSEISIDMQNDTVEIQAGASLGDIYSTLAMSDYGFPGGTCPSVGISGLVLGGGIGLSTRLFGLATDSLLQLKMVDARGMLLTANQDENSDLFWACRGAGGGNFGVVVSYKFKIYKVKKVTLIRLLWSNEAREEFLDLWQHFLLTANPKISCFAGIEVEGIYLNSFFYGSEGEARRILRDFLLLPGLSPESSIQGVPFIEAVRAIGSQYGPPGRFKSTGRFVYKTLSKETIYELIKYLDDCPKDNNCRISLYSLGGAVRRIESDETAYYYRNARYIMGISASWDKDEDAEIFKNWVAGGVDYIESFTCGSYVNFPYSELRDYQYAYYGENVERLEKVKRVYDPLNVFEFKQSIK